MNKIFNILSAAFIALAAIACDPVSEDERFNEATGINHERKVLVEEFTGQFCPNCPLGHEALKAIKSQYGDNVVIVSIHAGDMASDIPGYGLKTPDGDKYAAMWGVQQYPSAVVNRSTAAMPDRSQWQGAVLKNGLLPPEVYIKADARIANGKLTVTSTLTARSERVNANVNICITESGISAFQQDGEDIIMDYEHNHVYRASISDAAAMIPTDGMNVEVKDYDLDPSWNTDNLHVVEFVYNANGVLQAEEVKVVK